MRSHPERRDLPRLDGVPLAPVAMMTVLRPIVGAYTRRRYGVQVHRAEHVPTAGPVILAANHLGWLDGPLLAVHTPRPVHALTKKEMFTGVMDTFLRRGGQIPLDRFAADPAAIKTCLRVLAEGRAVGIFPEGARGAGDLATFQHGAGYLALVSGAPVVPVTFFGTREPGGDHRSRPGKGARVDIVYGEPWRIAAQPWPRRRTDVVAATTALRDHMVQALADATTLTGRELPGPLPAGDSEHDAANRQASL